MNQLKISAVIALLLLALAQAAVAEPQKSCPVMGGEINRDLYVDVEGKRIYVCCDYCIGEIKKDPAKYIKKLEDAGQELEAAPAK
ncbi:MAG: hypothetical protein ABFR97_05750 [Thermodesulfobacteriota bacterium]